MKKYKAIIYDIDGTILNTLKMNMVPLMRILEEETGEYALWGNTTRDESIKGTYTFEEPRELMKLLKI